MRFIVVSSSIEVAKNNTTYAKCHVFDGTSYFDINLWGCKEEIKANQGLYLDSSKLQINGNFKSAKFQDVKVLESSEEVKDILGKLPAPVSKEAWGKLIDACGKEFKYDDLEKFFRLRANELYPKYAKWIAAKMNHQSYDGGLLNHTYTLLRYAYFINKARTLDKDFVFDYVAIAGLFHDWGKLVEYKKTEKGWDYTPAIALMGHIYMSAHHVQEIMENEYAANHILRIVSCILSHHSHKEWGSPVEPCSFEARVLAEADQLSAWEDEYFYAEPMKKSYVLGVTVVKSTTPLE